MMSFSFSQLAAIVSVALSACGVDASTEDSLLYGMDIAYPHHYAPPSTNYPWLPHNVDPSLPVPEEYKDMPIQPLGDMKAKYDEYIQGCVDYYNENGGRGQRCVDNEEDRLEMSRRQVQSMKNYTEMGYTKIRAPEHVFKLVREFWDAHHEEQRIEKWPAGNIYTNHWASPTYILSVEDAGLEGGGYVLKQHIWNAARDTIEAWTGYRQAECSLYGIRVYKEGSILAPHVDRLPLVSSAIINVDQDVDEPWPLEVIGHDGIARNVTMLPGDMVLYESHSIIHSRPFPLKGRFMANVFIHFEPVGPIGGQVEYTGDLPPYVIEGSPEESNWRRSNPDGHVMISQRSFTTGSTDLHHHANVGDEEELKTALDEFPHLINVRDENGWSALHEAVRNGSKDVVKLLLDRGAEVNARTGSDKNGGTPLWLAKQYHNVDHEIVSLLIEYGGQEYKPYSDQEL